MQPQGFSGFTPDAFKFFLELGFNNEKAFFDANRERCRRVVQQPMRALANDLIPAALEMNPDFDTRMSVLVSRMNRDTRFSKNKLPYRDHGWIGFKPAESRTSESFCVYFEIEPGGYGYGMGMYDANPALMKPFRERALANPQKLLDLSAPLLARGFEVRGELFKKDRFPAAPEAVKPYLNRKGVSWCFFSKDIEKTFSREIFDETREAFVLMKPLYRFVMGLEQASGT
ncbi:MAG: hypothetical protein BWY35_01219 [Firmicutes bacterium ADurb.Bin248]|nr:MAG: hypothetical protein BWY35_01219 [Firmicutes bacterium ADurb.Bin248]HOF99764.1 DUF2461 domain-containing protein [Clostridia bacterium]HPK14694.1 DUF2461 domain-containing protein [Clostridia bacterium]